MVHVIAIADGIAEVVTEIVDAIVIEVADVTRMRVAVQGRLLALRHLMAAKAVVDLVVAVLETAVTLSLRSSKLGIDRHAVFLDC